MILFKRIDPAQWLFSQRTIEMHQSHLISRTLPNSQTFISTLFWISNYYLIKYLYNKTSFANITINCWAICEVLLSYINQLPEYPLPYSPFSCSPCKIKFLTFLLGCCHVPLRIFSNKSSSIEGCMRFLLWNFFFFLLKNSKKVISININCSNY